MIEGVRPPAPGGRTFPREEARALAPANALCAALAVHNDGQDPGQPFTPALHAAVLLLGVDDPPRLVLARDVVEDPERRAAIEASVPQPILRRPWSAATLVEARALLADWRAYLASRPLPGPGGPELASPLTRLRPLLAGHPTRDPDRHIAAIDSAR